MVGRIWFSYLLFALVVALSACGGDSGGISSDYVGDYTITSWTDNTENCDAEGDSVLEHRSKRMLVQVCRIEFMGTVADEFLGAYPCADDTDCEENRCSSTHIVISSEAYEFRDGDDDGGWVNSWSGAMTGFDAEEKECTGSHYDQKLTRSADGSLRIEVRSFEVVPFPSVEECEDFGGEEMCFDECTDAASTAAIQGQPCARLEVVEMVPLSE